MESHPFDTRSRGGLENGPKSFKNGSRIGLKRYILDRNWDPKMGSVSRPVLVASGIALESFLGSVLAPFLAQNLGPFSDVFGMLSGSVLEGRKGPWGFVRGGGSRAQIAPRNGLKSIYKFIYTDPKNSPDSVARPGPEVRRICTGRALVEPLDKRAGTQKHLK